MFIESVFGLNQLLEFEICPITQTACCRLCPKAKWTIYLSAESHATTAKHKNNARKDDLVVTRDSGIAKSANKVPIYEDCKLR